MDFDAWLAGLFGVNEREVKRLLDDEAVRHFLVAWSLFESTCFRGSLSAERFARFASRIVEAEGFNTNGLSESAKHFHARYQDPEKFRNLLHRKSLTKLDPDELKMQDVLSKDVTTLTPTETAFLSAFTAYRFRNNIFHGNKGVFSWLAFAKEIGYCVDAIQSFVTHARRCRPR